MKTHIINETNQTFQLKEGNAGAFRLLTELNARGKDGFKFSIKVDPNATYREYMVATEKKGNLSLSPQTTSVNTKSSK